MGVGVICSREKKAQESLKGRHTKSEVGLFSQAASDSNTRGNDLKLHQRILGKNFFTERVVKLWNRLSREAAESPSLEVLLRCVEVVLRMWCSGRLMVGLDDLRSLFQLKCFCDSVIISYRFQN